MNEHRTPRRRVVLGAAAAAVLVVIGAACAALPSPDPVDGLIMTLDPPTTSPVVIPAVPDVGYEQELSFVVHNLSNDDLPAGGTVDVLGSPIGWGEIDVTGTCVTDGVDAFGSCGVTLTLRGSKSLGDGATATLQFGATLGGVGPAVTLVQVVTDGTFPAELTVTPAGDASMTFNDTEVYTVTNVGFSTSGVVSAALSVSPGGEHQATGCGVTLAPNASCDITIHSGPDSASAGGIAFLEDGNSFDGRSVTIAS